MSVPWKVWGRKAGLLVAGALGLGLLFGSRTYLLYNAYPENSVSLTDAMVPAVTDWLLWALLAPVVIHAARRFPVDSGSWARAVPAHVALGVAVAVARYLLDVLAGAVLPWMPARTFSRAGFLFDVYPNVLTYAVLVIAVHAFDYGRRYRDRALRASQLEAALGRAQLQVLRMQLQPHFLFNTLNAVTTLMHRDVEAADRMLVRLGDLLRRTIDTIGVSDVPLREELAFLEAYLEIEETRFQDRLRVSVEVDPDLLENRVPHLILQPLVENAIRHGVEKRAAPGRVEVTARRFDGVLELTVRDEGPGLPPGWEPKAGKGLGLANVRERLSRLYGSEHALALTNRPHGGVEARLTLPLSGGDR